MAKRTELTPEERKRVVSFSQWAKWAECPLMWKYQYVDKIKPPQTIATIFGSAMHETIQQWLKIYFDNPKKAKMLDMSDILKDEMVKEFKAAIIEKDDEKIYPCTKEDMDEHFADGSEILRAIIKKPKDFLPSDRCELIGIEVPLTKELGNDKVFNAYLDLVFRDKVTGIYHIVDIKTSTKGWSDLYHKKDPKKTNQVLLYKQYYSEQYDVPLDQIIPSFVILKRKIVEGTLFPMKRISHFIPSNGKPSLKKAHASLTEFVETAFVKSGEWSGRAEPTPSKSNCRFCPFNNDANFCTVSPYLKKSE